jgi:hypothetical protein
MSYKIQFLGLVCFFREPQGRLAMLPDGTKPDDGIEPHYAAIAVDPRSVIESSGWNTGSRQTGIFELIPCTISIDGLDVAGRLDTTAHDGLLPRLGRLSPGFAIDPATAQTIATMPIRQGTLTAYRVPSGTAVMSELEVPHDGDIRITIVPHQGSPRNLRLRAGTEIAITNTADDYRQVSVHENHFRIYEKLSSQRPALRLPADASMSLAESPSEHFLFAEGRRRSLTADCSNTGCCP